MRSLPGWHNPFRNRCFIASAARELALPAHKLNTYMKLIDILIWIILLGFVLGIGVYSQWPLTITPDAAMHAEIVGMINEQGFLTS